MTVSTDTAERADLRHCGCCGRHLPAGKVAELGSAPGVFICAGCALWPARRAGPLSALARLPILRSLRRRHRHQPAAGGKARAAIPVLPSSDLDRTAAFYAPTGFVEGGRHPGYLLLHNAESNRISPNPAQRLRASATSTSVTPAPCTNASTSTRSTGSTRSPTRTTACASSPSPTPTATESGSAAPSPSTVASGEPLERAGVATLTGRRLSRRVRTVPRPAAGIPDRTGVAGRWRPGRPARRGSSSAARSSD